MAVKITIENLKGVKSLEFNVPSKNGVYLLVGPNGAGKTTLLACLDRICNNNAFARNFVYSNKNDEVDQYTNAVIKYEQDNPSCIVSFRKGAKRWAATPKRNSKCLAQFGFCSTVFIQADSKRISVPSDDIRPGNIEDASLAIVSEMNSLFDTERFGKLKRLKNTNGRGKTPQYYYVLQEGKNSYYSEKRFSTGEIALLRLVERLVDVPDKSLILLDEAELALHPRIQKNLLDYLQNVSSQKSLTIIVATHSVTMINATDKNHLLLLRENSKGKYEVVNPCYPARAVGSVDFVVNANYDALFFVEDDMAQLVLTKLLEKCKKIVKNYSNTAVIPVGPYKQTADFAISTRRMLFNHSKVFAVLDDDVFSEAIYKDEKLKNYLEENKEIVFSLGCTPELWMVGCLTNADKSVSERVCETFCIDIKTIMSSSE